MTRISKKRLRFFAGPNGSGKSTITRIVLDYAHLGTYVNADEIKVFFTTRRFLDFSTYNVHLDRDKFIDYAISSSLSSRLRNIDNTLSMIMFQHDKMMLCDDYVIEDYFVSLVTAYIWNQLLDNSQKFTVETVMSHPSKLDFIRLAKEKGFKVYLYFVSLADPKLNQHRVKARVAQGGHPVDEEKIVSRYYKTMDNLYEALKIVDNAYIFDNSAGAPNMFAVKEKGILRIESDYIPKWFETYVLNLI